jgi:hypothetical protein
MIIIALLIFIVLAFLGARWDWCDGNSVRYQLSVPCLVIGAACATIMVGVLLFAIFHVCDGKVIDDRIVMYQEENTQIEKDIEIVVSEYMDYEQDTFDMSEISSPTTLVQMYPELKSDKLVQQQIDVYVSNNDKIKELKNKEIDVKLWKWLLYFGGN